MTNSTTDSEDIKNTTEATNAAIARRVAKEYAGTLCYVRSTDRPQAIDRAAGWLAYRADGKGGVWTRKGAEKAVIEAIDHTIRVMLVEAAHDPDSSRVRERTRDLVNALNRLPAIKQVATYYLDKPLSDFNTDPYLLNVKNGTLNLAALAPDAHEELFRPARAEDHCSKQAAAVYDPTAKATGLLTFLHEVFEGDAEVIAFVQRALGYTLLGVNPEHAAFICFGEGGNGKGVLLDTISDALGSYAGVLSPDVLVSDYVRSGSSLQPEMTAHRDVRLIVSSEPKRGVLNSHRMKSWTGDSHVQLRQLYGEADEMQVTWTFWMTTNALPDLNEQTAAVERRMHIVPFRVCFRGRENLDLRDELAKERDGVLNWLLDGLADWYRRRASSPKGDSGLCPPEAIVQASQDWLTSESVFTRLFEEMLIRGTSQDRILLSELRDALTTYVDEHPEDFPRAFANTKLINNLLKTFGLEKRTVGGQVYVYGVKFDKALPGDNEMLAVIDPDDPFTGRELAYMALCENRIEPMRVGEIAEATDLPQRSLYVTLARMAEEGLIYKAGHAYTANTGRLVLDKEDEQYNEERDTFIQGVLWKLLHEEAGKHGGGVVTIDEQELGRRAGLGLLDAPLVLQRMSTYIPGLVRKGYYEWTFDPKAPNWMEVGKKASAA